MHWRKIVYGVADLSSRNLSMPIFVSIFSFVHNTIIFISTTTATYICHVHCTCIITLGLILNWSNQPLLSAPTNLLLSSFADPKSPNKHQTRNLGAILTPARHHHHHHPFPLLFLLLPPPFSSPMCTRNIWSVPDLLILSSPLPFPHTFQSGSSTPPSIPFSSLLRFLYSPTRASTRGALWSSSLAQ